jgi:hypothetical protein
LLQVAAVVVEGAGVAFGLQDACVLDHLGVEVVEALVVDGIFDDYQAVAVDVADGALEVLVAEAAALDLKGGGLYGDWVGGKPTCGCEGPGLAWHSDMALNNPQHLEEAK